MASSKSSQTTRNIVIAFLALWSIISLIIIVVWSTSPDMKSAAKCRADMETQREKYEGAEMVWKKDRLALEEHLARSWENQTQLRKDIDMLTEDFWRTNTSLRFYRDENVILSENITELENQTATYRKIVANLTSEIAQQKDYIENLTLNLTSTRHLRDSCEHFRVAAVSQMNAAESQWKACKSDSQSLQNQLSRCKKPESTESIPPREPHNGSAGRLTVALALTLLPLIILRLIFSCEFSIR